MEWLDKAIHRAQSIHILGAGRNFTSQAHQAIIDLDNHGWRLVPIHPRDAGRTILGRVIRREIEDGIIPEIVVFFLAPKRTMEAILTMIVKYNSDQMPLIWLQRGAESDEIVEMLESNNIKHVKDDCIVEYITGKKMNKVPKCENQPWFRQISDEDGSGCSVWQAFKPLETGNNFTTELEWAGDLEDLAKSQHTIARYIRSLAKPDETLFEAAIRLS